MLPHERTEAAERIPGFGASETPAYVARGVAALAADPGVARHHGAVLTAGAEAACPKRWATPG